MNGGEKQSAIRRQGVAGVSLISANGSLCKPPIFLIYAFFVLVVFLNFYLEGQGGGGGGAINEVKGGAQMKASQHPCAQREAPAAD